MNRIRRWAALCLCAFVLIAAREASAFGNMAGGGSEGAKAPASTEPIKVEKAKGADAYTVAEVYEKAAKLEKKTVVVRGKVVKVSKMIMDRNWVHLRDGSGDASKGTNNLVFTGKAAPKVGDVVTAKGTLYKDKDFGAGYLYKAIVEESTFKP
ncbi:MAG: hypothetical protein C4529_05690 [Deltaproteobacteria bacterium]|nr:MAG: hypothetical protein C4529_05690 [Deltaproteobacteria bacterium]